MAELQCEVVTPEKTLLDEPAEFVALPLYDGEIGIAPGHSPMIGRLGYGEMRLTWAGKTRRFYVDGGFVQVNANAVSVLTNRAEPAGEIDDAEAEKQLAAAQRIQARAPEEVEARDQAVTQARARLRVARRPG
jgi:F-type H+-transporting ATPase subunit epsilon